MAHAAQARALDLPGATTQQRHLATATLDPRHGNLVGPDHEVDVELAAVDAWLILLADGELEPLAERDVAGCVLVEQGVEEHGVEGADSALAVDQRHLPQPGGAGV